MSLHVYYKCRSVTELIATKSSKSDAKYTEQSWRGKTGKPACSHFCLAVFSLERPRDKRAVVWSQEATSWPLVKAAQLLWFNIMTDLLGLTSHVSISQKYPRHQFAMTFWLKQNISVLQVCWQRGSRAHQAKWCQFLWGGDFSENASACCLAALNGRISRCWAMSFIRWSLTGDIEWHLGQLRVLPGAGCRMWVRHDFKYLKKL